MIQSEYVCSSPNVIFMLTGKLACIWEVSVWITTTNPFHITTSSDTNLMSISPTNTQFSLLWFNITYYSVNVKSCCVFMLMSHNNVDICGRHVTVPVVRCWLLNVKSWVPSCVILYEILCGWRRRRTRFSRRSFGFPSLMVTLPLFNTHQCPLKCEIVLTRQHIITSSVFKFGALSSS
jgi:hypothetical protein